MGPHNLSMERTCAPREVHTVEAGRVRGAHLPKDTAASVRRDLRSASTKGEGVSSST